MVLILPIAQHFSVPDGPVSWVGRAGGLLYVRFRRARILPVHEHRLQGGISASTAFAVLLEHRLAGITIMSTLCDWDDDGSIDFTRRMKRDAPALKIFESIPEEGARQRRRRALPKQRLG